ncbi:molybdenum cofactor biosynthesis protein MoaC [Dyadobacter sp. BE34]|uniref:Molybdopterin adenylyltransferase n=1 Tax=Dyadobacter fermentans TaxID=94254 RepID=A0ABU1R496_9BACT|nr:MULTISPECIES: bifunctional molybdenum cofactor biosynthesis protein MoaC/MoaB [Dyadobacter]MDR6808242.1 molybdenum cofactor biosynthesis protein MoaC [Dyadobacter fermentans]MDR7045942.1 molybdenum cofactor biosynthesis protein MoaC [Dyadobacter sp. BE242]MDR7200255.1 molybdenum cofactor biosynthesis protein MoaC [Dyadobacter sp. BE34]MDR7218215.1 molybdenum cofactor biosynthesis protein MoaC [Dyadobacter sp. BE31]MDR7266146.1 molybdenum cofactor biosynthesis protein MoaC [Dyadobacter sp. B
MVDITHKTNTLRIATAQAIVQVSKPETVEAIQNRTVPKGDVFEMAKAAGFLAVKKTPDLLPDCHPIPVEYTGVQYRIEDLTIVIELTVKTIYKTGVEVEAMHGASVVALTMYDMLKPIDKGVEIRNIRLLEKKGGKSDRKPAPEGLKTAVVVCSDSISKGIGEDKSGKKIIEKLKAFKLEVSDYSIIADDKTGIQTKLQSLQTGGYDMVLITGGTGLSPRDVTPEAVSELLDREIPGIAETARQYGQERVPTSMLSRSAAGFIGEMLVITMPGSTGGVTEYIDALFPHVLHVFNVLEGKKHD